MKRTLATIGLLALFGFAQASLAQTPFERCEKQKTDVTALKARVTDLDNQNAPLEIKIQKVQKRLRDLETQRADRMREKASLLQQVRMAERDVERMCSSFRQCETLDNRIDDLKRRSAPMAEAMRKLLDEIRERNTDSARINQEVDKIESTYKQLNCDELVAGQTAQTTIDRCNSLFSDWNRLQTDVNRMQDSAQAFRNRYTQENRQLVAMSQEINRLLTQMRASCGHSTRLSELEGLDREHQGYSAVKKDIDDMDSNVKRVRAMRVIQPKMMKNTIRPKDDDNKHKIQPVH
jgi:chromosome segregation ATPase